MTSFLTLFEADLWGTVLVLGGFALFLQLVGGYRRQCRDTDEAPSDPLTEARSFRSE